MADATDLLRHLVDANGYVDDPALLRAASHEPTNRFGSAPSAIVRPPDVASLASVLAVCSDRGVAVVPQGGNTGLVGGSVAHDGEVLLRLDRLDPRRSIDPLGPATTVGASVTCAAADSDARMTAGPVPLRFPVDLGSRDHATIGGMIATNAGGVRFLRHGGMRRHLIGVEAVLADGTVVSHLDAPTKDNTGYHLPSLLCGSEGTLGVVTAATISLLPRPEGTSVALVPFDSWELAVGLCAALRDGDAAVEAIELMTAPGVELVLGRSGSRARRPFDPLPPVMVLVERVGSDDPGHLHETLVGLGVGDAVMATDRPSCESLWLLREGHTGAIGSLGAVHKLDVTLPLTNLASFATDVADVVGSVAPTASLWLFGHAGDGNLHVNVTGVPPDVAADDVDEAVLRLVAEMNGSISAEHGIGVAKRPWLHLARSPEEIATFRRLKRALDPAGILNPAVLLGPET